MEQPILLETAGRNSSLNSDEYMDPDHLAVESPLFEVQKASSRRHAA
jgi:hypothetical protein